MSAPATVSMKAVGLRSERGPLLAALMLATALVALEQTIIATAVPSIVADLGAFSQFPWLFSIYLLAQAVSTPIYGRLSDVVGRKPVMLAGIGLFLVGSVFCAVAWSMTALIVFRAVQGLGAGAVLPMSNTIAGDIYSVAERAKVQGYLASMWGISAFLGPALGGTFSQFFDWRWIFWMNVPLGLIVVRRAPGELLGEGGAQARGDRLSRRRVAQRRLRPAHPRPARGRRVVGVGLGRVGDHHVGRRRCSLPSSSSSSAGWPPRSCRSGSSPVASCWLPASPAQGSGAIVLGLSAYVPTFAQGVLGATPVTAGFALATLTVGWPLAAAFSGRLYLRFGFRLTALLGSVLVVTGTLLVRMAAETVSLPFMAAACFVVGTGLGLIASPTLIAAQSSVGWAERGVVTGNNMFSRTLGSAVAVAAFGAVANAVLDRASGSGEGPVEVLADASAAVFTGVAVVALATVAAIAFMPGRSPSTSPAPEAVPLDVGVPVGTDTAG